QDRYRQQGRYRSQVRQASRPCSLLLVPFALFVLPYFSSISYSFSFLYSVLSLIPRSKAASFLLLLCFLSALTMSSFSLSIMFRLSSTISCSWISLFIGMGEGFMV